MSGTDHIQISSHKIPNNFAGVTRFVVRALFFLYFHLDTAFREVPVPNFGCVSPIIGLHPCEEGKRAAVILAEIDLLPVVSHRVVSRSRFESDSVG